MNKVNTKTYEEFKNVMEEAYKNNHIIRIHNSHIMDFESALVIDMNDVNDKETLDLKIYKNKHPYNKHIVILTKEDIDKIKKMEENTRKDNHCIYCGHEIFCVDDINESGYQANIFQCQVCGTRKYVDGWSYHFYDLPKKPIVKE